MYEYNATLDRVVDGDTLILTVDLGFYLKTTAPFRLARIDAPELSTEAGKQLKQLLQQYEGQPVQITTSKNPKDKYGRYLAEVGIFFNDKTPTNLNDYLVYNGYAVKYGGGAR